MAEGKSDDSDKDDKTEDASEHKLEKAREEGNAPFSREILQLSVIMAGAIGILYVIPLTVRYFIKGLTPFLSMPHTFTVDNKFLSLMFIHVGKSTAILLGGTIALIFLFLLSAGLGQKGRSLTFKSLKPKISNLSIKKGLEKIFSSKAVVEFLKNIVKIIVMGIAIYYNFKSYVDYFDQWIWLSIADFFHIFHDVNFAIFLTIILAFGAVAVFDFFYQKYTFMKKMRMSKQDQKEEYKQMEGDPHVQQRIRQLRHERAQQRMMGDVPSATGVLMNPTHYAVAFKWSEETMEAPIVVAKGQDLVALRIRDVAKEQNQCIKSHSTFFTSTADLNA